MGVDDAKPVRVIPPLVLVQVASYLVTAGNAVTAVNATVICWLPFAEIVPIDGAPAAAVAILMSTPPEVPLVMPLHPVEAPLPPFP